GLGPVVIGAPVLAAAAGVVHRAHIRAGGAQRLGHVVLLLVPAPVQRLPAVIVGCVDVGFALQQQIEDLLLAALDRLVQGPIAVLILLGVFRGSILVEDACNGHDVAAH